MFNVEWKLLLVFTDCGTVLFCSAVNRSLATAKSGTLLTASSHINECQYTAI